MTIFTEVGWDKRSPLCLGLFEMVSLLLLRFLDTGLPEVSFWGWVFLELSPGTRTKSSPGSRCPIKTIVSWKKRNISFRNYQSFRGAWNPSLLSAYTWLLPHMVWPPAGPHKGINLTNAPSLAFSMNLFFCFANSGCWRMPGILGRLGGKLSSTVHTQQHKDVFYSWLRGKRAQERSLERQFLAHSSCKQTCQMHTALAAFLYFDRVY